MKQAAFFVAILFAMSVWGQNPENIEYNWDENPVYAAMDSLDGLYDAVILKDKCVYDFYYDAESGDLKMLYIFHRAYRITRENMTEELNTLNIETAGMEKLVNLQARVISPDGKITVVDTSEIKLVENEVEGGTYKAVALPGICKGATVDYFYVYHTSPELFISRTFQTSVPRYNIDFTLECPDGLGFISKSYNGLPEWTETRDSVASRIMYSIHSDFIPAMPEQRYSNGSPYQQRLLVSVAYNYNRNKARMFTHAEFCGAYWERMFEHEKKEAKSLAKIVKAAKPESEDRLTAARQIENYLKTTFFQKAISLDLLERFEFMRNTGMASEAGINKVYLNVYKQLGYDVQLLYTCTRDYMFFDKTFNTYNQLNDAVIYFPEFKLYMSPGYFPSRLGFPDQDVIAQDALWMKETSVAGEGAFVPAYTTIGIPDYKASYDSLFQTLVIDAEGENAWLKCRRSFTGYKAMTLQPAYSFLDEEEKEEYLNAHFDFGHVFFDFDSAKVYGSDKEDVMIKPFVVKAGMKAGNLLSKTGDHLLVLAGELIGPQAELYDSIERTHPVDHGYPCGYYRMLRFEIPEGYSVDNAAEFDIDIALTGSNGEKMAYFVSKQHQEGNVFIVEIDEGYTEVVYQLADFEKFRQVVNAAADFNKLTLVLVKN